MKHLTVLIAVACLLFASRCSNSPTNKGDNDTESTKQQYLKRGQEIAAATFATLSSRVQKAMQEGGVTNAVQYCNLAAHPLVDSLEQVYQADIKRTSLKVRNPKNKPTDKERQQLQRYQTQFKAGNTLEPLVQKINNQLVFQAPIYVMPLCEKCHGKIGDQLKKQDYATIQKLYPLDKAINYKSGDFRGMWSISFRQ